MPLSVQGGIKYVWSRTNHMQGYSQMDMGIWTKMNTIVDLSTFAFCERPLNCLYFYINRRFEYSTFSFELGTAPKPLGNGNYR